MQQNCLLALGICDSTLVCCPETQLDQQAQVVYIRIITPYIFNLNGIHEFQCNCSFWLFFFSFSWVKKQLKANVSICSRWWQLKYMFLCSVHPDLCGKDPIWLYERPPKPPTFWNSYTRTLILDTIMKLSGTIGVTQKTMTLDTHVRLILLQTLNPQERWGTHKKRWPFQPRLFADVIGLVRCSYNIF